MKPGIGGRSTLVVRGSKEICVTADVGNADRLGHAVCELSAAHGLPLIAIGRAKCQKREDFADINDLHICRASFERHTTRHVANRCFEPAGHLTVRWIDLDGGLHRSAF